MSYAEPLGAVAEFDVWVEDISHPSGNGGYHASVNFIKPAVAADEEIFRVKPHDGRRVRYVNSKRCVATNLNQ